MQYLYHDGSYWTIGPADCTFVADLFRIKRNHLPLNPEFRSAFHRTVRDLMLAGF